MISQPPGAQIGHVLIVFLCIGGLASEWNLVRVSHLLHVSRNHCLSILLGDVCNYQAFIDIEELGSGCMLVVLALDRSTP